jgi:hypothetical protein
MGWVKWTARGPFGKVICAHSGHFPFPMTKLLEEEEGLKSRWNQPKTPGGAAQIPAFLCSFELLLGETQRHNTGNTAGIRRDRGG